MNTKPHFRLVLGLWCAYPSRTARHPIVMAADPRVVCDRTFQKLNEIAVRRALRKLEREITFLERGR